MQRLLDYFRRGNTGDIHDVMEVQNENAQPPEASVVHAEIEVEDENMAPMPVARPNWPQPRPPIRHLNRNAVVRIFESRAIHVPTGEPTYSDYLLQTAFQTLTHSRKDAISFRDIKQFITNEYYGNRGAASSRLRHVKTCLVKALDHGRVENIAHEDVADYSVT